MRNNKSGSLISVIKVAFLCSILCLFAGCASTDVVERERYFWPLPPNPPRIEWLGAYNSQLDLKVTAFRRIKEFVTGEDAPVSIKKAVEVRADAVLDKIYVADAELGGIYVFDMLNSESRMISLADTGLPDRINPVGMAIDKDHNLYVLEPRRLKILVFDSSEKFKRIIDLNAVCKRPVAIAIDKNSGRLYVSDVQLNKIFVLDTGGTRLFDFGSAGSREGEFNKPVSIAIASGGNVIVADSFNARIQIFDKSGAFLNMFGKRGDNVGNFQLLKAVAVDADDNIYVVDGRSHSVNIFNQQGELLLSLGNFYMVSNSGKLAPGGFSLPTGIDIDERGRIFVADQLNNRIQAFQYITEAQSLTIPTKKQAK